MSRKFKTVDYEASLNQQVSWILRECLPPGHLARFIARVITELDLQEIYGVYGSRGGVAIAPEILLGLTILRLCHRRIQLTEDRAGYL